MDFSKIKDFDAHIEHSIPGYGVLSDTFRHLAVEYMDGSDRRVGIMIDLGCTTGSFLSKIKKHDCAFYIGVDHESHPDRIPCEEGGYDFQGTDICYYLKSIKRADVISSLFTLQFVGAGKRQEALAEIKRLVDGGAVFLCAAKVHLHDSRVNSSIHRLHIQHKRTHFSDTEILDKEMTMQGSMQYQKEADFISDMSEIGEVSLVWASLGFIGVLVKKG